ncbi:2OG-Fe(II) oxygenase superfamily protein [Microdochium bolleyi]|uniref:2OG-Fe(II) oxygenase superfamily protein n=1 Tax=Microdochium bolleyi TaxID=196109 RepID=A0A136J6F4_9PEZI|nr:2OG-Fe(II) oxygenase superfamily protein [Microdochium bolleyi]
MAVNAQIPIIDISVDGADQVDVARRLVDAAAEHGFIYIRNTGQDISADRIQRAFELARTLFASPVEDKQRCSIQKNNQGWSGMHSETLDPKSQRVGDFKEAFNFGSFKDGRATQPVPASMDAHQEELAAFRNACHTLCRKLLLLFGIGLEVSPPDFFTSAHNPDAESGTILRFLRYPPPTETPDAQADDVRAGAHSDYGSVTLLFRIPGQAGLEVLTPSNTWAPVPVTPQGTENDPSPPILVNIGDLLSYWTNGLLRSTVHRVSFSPGQAATGESSVDPRYTLVFFCHPAHDTPLVPVPSERVRSFAGVSSQAKEGNPYAERKVVTAAEHLQMRLQASYADLYKDNAA